MKKPKRITLRRKADKLWSQLIMRRNKGKCEVCGKKGTNPHHIVGRRNLTLRHDVRNGVLLCSYHHTFSKDSAHQNILWFMDWLDDNRLADVQYLTKKGTELTTQIDYEERIEKLTKLLRGGE